MKRTWGRMGAFALFAGLLWFGGGTAARYAQSPLLGIAALGDRGAPVGVWITAALLIVVCLFFRRFFCRWLCPLGLLQDGVNLAARRFFPGIKFSSRWAILGKTLLFATIFALMAGGIGFLWLDPIALFSALGPRSANRAAAALLIAAALITTAALPKFWCVAFCPCGALSELLFSCRTWIVRIARRKTSKEESCGEGKFSHRRSFFRTFFGILAAMICAVPIFALLRRVAASEAAPLRPPGAVGEADFLARCARCGACVRVCPTGLLRPVHESAVTLGTPQVDFDRGWCETSCERCAQVCPTGAIQTLAARFKTVENSIGNVTENVPGKIAALPQFRLEACRLWHDRECAVCLRECPTGAIAFVWNQEEYLNLPVVDETLCSGCGRCAHFCPGVDGTEKGFVMVGREAARRGSLLAVARRDSLLALTRRIESAAPVGRWRIRKPRA